MGHKIRPNSLRTGIIRGWSGNWFPKKNKFGKSLEEDILIRKIINEKIGTAGIDKIVIERIGSNYRISIKAARPGIIIGRGGKGVENLTRFLDRKLSALRRERNTTEPVTLNLNIEELKRQEISANVVAQNIAWDLEKRIPHRRAVKKHLDQIMQNRDVQGAKILVKGRLDGAEIARDTHLERGKLPLQTLRADIDYGVATAYTTYGTIGIKVWIYKGEVFNK